MKNWMARLRARNDLRGRLLQILLLALAYYVVGRVAMLQVVPPATAALVWPSAGLALVGVLLFGWTGVLGTFIGSVLISLHLYIEPGAYLRALAMAGVGASGTALQAWLGAVLIRRFVGFPTPLIRDREIVVFLLLGGPVACVVNAAIRTLVLYLSDSITVDGVWFQFFAWWVGHTIGVLIFTPLLLMWLVDSVGTWRSRRLSVGLPLILTFVVAVLVFVLTSSADQRQGRVDVERRVQSIGEALQLRLENSVSVLHSLNSFYASSESVDRAEFHRFAGGVLRHQRGLYALSWLRYVREADRPAFEQQLQAEGVGEGIFEEDAAGQRIAAPRRDDYLVLTYIEPFTGARALRLGFNGRSRETNIPAQDRARDTGTPSMTPRFLLRQEPGEQYAIAVYMPVYRGGVVPATVEERREQLVGMLSASFRLSDLMQSALATVDRAGLDLTVTDESTAGAATSLFTADRPSAPLHGADRRQLDHTVRLEVAGRQWQIRGVQNEQYVVAHRSAMSWVALLGGLLFTSLLGGFLMILTGRAAQVEALVDERTRELSHANADLEREQALIARMLEELKASRDAAEVATRAKSEFLANMSHEIRTPMTAILGFTGLLAQEAFESPDAREKAIQAIQRNGEHLLTIINDILDLSKIEAGKLSIEQIPIRPDELLHDVRRTFADSARAKGIGLEVTLPPDPVPAILGDPVRVRQVVMNLVSNAIKFTLRGQVRLSVSFDQQTRDLTFEVADTGIGMSQDQVSELFQPFSQAEASTTRRFGGTGLGLRISKRLTEMMGGDLKVSSTPGNGTVFTYQLFARTVVDEADAQNGDGTVYSAAGLTRPLAGLHILAVDDSPDNRALVEMLLRRAGAEVTLLEMGTQAIDWVQERLRAHEAGHRPRVHGNALGVDLILMDMQMPGLDGPETVRRLRAMRTPCAIVALTANAMESDRIRCFDAGFDDFIAKPINPPLLFEKCRRWAEYSRSYLEV